MNQVLDTSVEQDINDAVAGLHLTVRLSICWSVSWNEAVVDQVLDTSMEGKTIGI